MRRFILLLSLSSSVLLCDVVELKTGERLEGTFKQATSGGVVIEVGGQAIKMPLAKVRAIYFGAAPSARGTGSRPSGASAALQALKSVQSVTTVGVNLRDYTTRVADAKLIVDQFNQSPPEKNTPFGERASRKPISLAMRYYELAAQAWRLFSSSDNASGSGLMNLASSIETDPEIRNCAALKELFASPVARETGTGILIGSKPAVLWACASDNITEAERLMK